LFVVRCLVSNINEGKMFINNESKRVVGGTRIGIRLDILNATSKKGDDGQIVYV
jgi:hypothetical protein